MPIIESILSQGATPATTLAVTADRVLFVAAQAGLRLLGWRARGTSLAGSVGNILAGTSGTPGTTNVLVPFQLSTNVDGQWFGDAGGILCPDGITIDWVSGSFEITLYTAVVN